MTTELVDLIAKKFIARRDVKAMQHTSGDAYFPVLDRSTKERLPWTREDLEDHLAGRRTYGHYLVNQDNECKLFAFDVDLRKNELDPSGNRIWTGSAPIPEHYGEAKTFTGEIIQFDPRVAWLDRAHPARPWIKYQLHMIGHALCSSIEKELDIPCAVAYSGSKGIHVYGFTGLMSAADVREGAQIVLDSLNERQHGEYGVQPLRGKHFYKFVNDDPIEGFPNLSVEVYPKQDSLDQKDVGNLMRLPLGRNFKSEDPTFFVDMTSPLNELAPVDPIHALTSSSPFKMPGE